MRCFLNVKGRTLLVRPSFCLVSSVVIEITLDIDDGGTLVTGAGGQIAQRADQVG